MFRIIFLNFWRSCTHHNDEEVYPVFNEIFHIHVRFLRIMVHCSLVSVQNRTIFGQRIVVLNLHVNHNAMQYAMSGNVKEQRALQSMSWFIVARVNSESVLKRYTGITFRKFESSYLHVWLFFNSQIHERKCPLTTVTCSYVTLGCNFKVPNFNSLKYKKIYKEI